MEVFANPSGGPERNEHIFPFFDKYIRDESIILTDKAKAYAAYCIDNIEKKLVHCIINHKNSVKKKSTFVWVLFLDKNDFEFLSNEIEISVSTESADGFAGVLKHWLHQNGGVRRKDMQAYVKEKQWRRNHNDHDLFQEFLSAWSLTETDLR